MSNGAILSRVACALMLNHLTCVVDHPGRGPRIEVTHVSSLVGTRANWNQLTRRERMNFVSGAGNRAAGHQLLAERQRGAWQALASDAQRSCIVVLGFGHRRSASRSS